MLSQCAYSCGVKIIKLAWVGTRTENFEPTVEFFRDVLGLRSELDLPGFRVLKLPDGSKVEIFGPTATSIVTSRRVQLQASLLTMSEQPPVSFGPTGLKFSLLSRTKAVMPGCTSVRRTATSMSSPTILAFRGRIRKRPRALLNCTEAPYQVKRAWLSPT